MRAATAGLQVELPAECAHWLPAIAAHVEAVAAGAERDLARWPELAAAVPPRLILCSSPAAAARLLAPIAPELDPRVPRTFPGLGWALVPLPRADALLTSLEVPPQTLLHSLAHEAVHLWCAARPALADAPVWFLEGLAEAASGAPPLAVEGRPLAVGEAPLAAETRLTLWAATARILLASDSGPRPWEGEPAPDPAEFDGTLAAPLRGRDAHADPERGLWVAATLPAQVVEVDLPPLAPGETRRFALQVGVSGAAEGGLLLRPADGTRLRLRCDAVGGLAAWREDPAQPARAEAGDRAAASAAAGQAAPRSVMLEHRGDELVLYASPAFVRRFPLTAAARAYPVALTLYARDAVCVARAQP